MKHQIGLLICDHVQETYQAFHGNYPAMFARLFPDFEFIHYDVCRGHFPASVHDCEVYMATGSLHSVYEELDWIAQLKAFVREIYLQEKYFIGFCFGHQLIGAALGGKVEKASQGWSIGVHTYTIAQQKNWMIPFQQSFNILMMCQDQVLELPQGGISLASTPTCPNAMIQVGEKILGIQGHPEFTKAYDKVLMQDRVERMGLEKVKSGLASLSLSLDVRLFRQWVIEFLKDLN